MDRGTRRAEAHGMRFVVGAVVTLLLASAAFACTSATSGLASDDDFTDDPARGARTGVDDPGSAPEAAEEGAVADGGTATDASRASADAGSGDAGANGRSSKCLADSTAESESNGTQATADPLPKTGGSYCGTLSGGADDDHLSFILPTTSSAVGLELSSPHLSGVVVDGVVDGQSFRFGTGVIPKKPGSKYVLKVSHPNDTTAEYLLTVTFK